MKRSRCGTPSPRWLLRPAWRRAGCGVAVRRTPPSCVPGAHTTGWRLLALRACRGGPDAFLSSWARRPAVGGTEPAALRDPVEGRDSAGRPSAPCRVGSRGRPSPIRPGLRFARSGLGRSGQDDDVSSALGVFHVKRPPGHDQLAGPSRPELHDARVGAPSSVRRSPRKPVAASRAKAPGLEWGSCESIPRLCGATAPVTPALRGRASLPRAAGCGETFPCPVEGRAMGTVSSTRAARVPDRTVTEPRGRQTLPAAVARSRAARIPLGTAKIGWRCPGTVGGLSVPGHQGSAAAPGS